MADVVDEHGRSALSKALEAESDAAISVAQFVDAYFLPSEPVIPERLREHLEVYRAAVKKREEAYTKWCANAATAKQPQV